MNFSYWENKHLVQPSDFTIVGAGISGLTTSIFLKKKYPNRTIRILERGITPWGASTKNAGFACFGSISEILSDLKIAGEDKTIQLVEKRWTGLRELRSLLGDANIGLLEYGGFELFTKEQKLLESECIDSVSHLNSLLTNVIGDEVFELSKADFGFSNVNAIIKNNYEAQIDTGLMMKNLIGLASELNIEIFYGAELKDYERNEDSIKLNLEGGMNLLTDQLIICTNGFAKTLIDLDVAPARAQVLITKPISGLKIKGTFHLEEGYYYFRNIDDRILFGGGRNLDFTGEETTEMETTNLIMGKLKRYLDDVILPNQSYEIDYSWAGVMGVGKTKAPIVKKLKDNVYCGVRLGGMGVAIGALVGKELSELIEL